MSDRIGEATEQAEAKVVGPIVHHPACTKADVRVHCDCGANRSCSTCGWGNGAYPCACNRAALSVSDGAGTNTGDAA